MTTTAPPKGKMHLIPVDVEKHDAGMERMARKLQERDDRAHAWEDPKWFVNE